MREKVKKLDIIAKASDVASWDLSLTLVIAIMDTHTVIAKTEALIFFSLCTLEHCT